MGSTTAIQNDYEDRYVVSFVGVNILAAVLGSLGGLVVVGGAAAAAAAAFLLEVTLTS